MGISKVAAVTLCIVVTATSMVVAQNQTITTPISNWSYQRHSSTATEGYLRGTAAVVQAVGQSNYLNSIAAVNHQEAHRRQIENSNLYVKTYFANKEINRQYREKYARVPLTKEQWARITAAALPDRLTAEQFDPTTGTLVWPHVLRTNEYKAFRDRIDVLVANRTPENSGDGSPSQRELAELIDGMQLLLKMNVNTLSPSQFGAASWFLKSVDYEAQLPMTGIPVVADAGRKAIN